jgi:hypothetical protein
MSRPSLKRDPLDNPFVRADVERLCEEMIQSYRMHLFRAEHYGDKTLALLGYEPEHVERLRKELRKKIHDT